MFNRDIIWQGIVTLIFYCSVNYYLIPFHMIKYTLTGIISALVSISETSGSYSNYVLVIKKFVFLKQLPYQIMYWWYCVLSNINSLTPKWNNYENARNQTNISIGLMSGKLGGQLILVIPSSSLAFCTANVRFYVALSFIYLKLIHIAPSDSQTIPKIIF